MKNHKDIDIFMMYIARFCILKFFRCIIQFPHLLIYIKKFVIAQILDKDEKKRKNNFYF